ncbi:pyrimidine reductase family protein [Streptomyces armeniacus]|uniref:Pyrimidine reductase family protein n=1 Tax=Streptomyces armeniacus TaxID=83291 RepID=A0A345XMK2_9ACTN|nr:pyrimidine reductase family protein [Streptomyces armeniacus]AXK32868.1 pyrimidine reductase family protein [Streptomyces armeniacus]
MRRLFPSARPDVSAAQPAGGPAETADGGEWSLEELADAYAYPELPRTDAAGGTDAASGSWLRANMVGSLDGAAYHGGHSKPLSSPADMRIFGVLRGLADVVIVGAETVRHEGYRPARRREGFAARRASAGQGPAPAIAVVSGSLDLDFALPLFTEPWVPTLVLTGSAAPEDRLAEAREAGAEVLVAGDGALVDPARAVEVLARRGLRRQLTEGGPRLLGQFAAAGVLDEFCLAVAPRVALGSAARVMDAPEVETPAEFVLESLLEEEGFLFTRYRRAGHQAPEGGAPLRGSVHESAE